MPETRAICPEQITAFLRLLFRPGEVFEVRVLDAERSGGGRPRNESGYFDYEHIDEVPKALAGVRRAAGVCVTINPTDPALLARVAYRLRVSRRGETTSDTEVVCRRTFLIDIDPVRPAGICATDAEKELAFQKAMEVCERRTAAGWPPPVVIDSGNGFHLVYLIDLPADDDGLIRRCLQALQAESTDQVHIDVSVSNASRISRIPGTWNCKGDDMPDRPHRPTEILEAPETPQVVPVALLEALAATVAPSTETRHTAPCAPVSPAGDRPGDDYNQRGEIATLLKAHGWQHLGDSGDNQLWRRPGKTTGNHSATFDGRTFFVFSSAAPPFEANTGYSPFAAYAMLEHGGNLSAAATALRDQGYGAKCPTDDVELSGIMAMCGAPRPHAADNPEISATMRTSPTSPALPADNAENPTAFEIFQPRTLAERLAEGYALNKPVIHGLLREGETMNVIASPKIGKSWMASALAISVAAGLDWLGFPVEQGPVLHIDNELHANTSTFRYHRVAEAMGVSPHLFSQQLTTVSLRGRLVDLNRLGMLFAAYPPGAFKLVIVDAFYRALPSDTNENDNGAMATLYNLIDLYAMRMDCAFVLIHHTSKGNQSGKFVTDVGAGAGAQSRAVDTHACLRQHEEENLVVFEAATRSWPPVAPLALQWTWPLFTPVAEVDTSALMGMAKPQPAKKPPPPLDEFVQTCVANQDPCSERAVVYEAQQTYGMARRAAEDMLALAREKGLVAKIKAEGAHMKYVKQRAGLVGDGALWIGALIAQNADASSHEIAEATGQTRQYVNQIRRQINAAQSGNWVETGGGNSETGFHSVSDGEDL